jgi:hypothetical protein
MPFVPATNTVMAEMRYIWIGQKCENTLYFYNSSGWSLSTMATLATQLFTWWGTALKAQQVALCALNEIYITDLTTNTSPTHSYVPASGNVGTNAGTSVPNNVAVCVSLRTAARGRSARGRNYVLGLPTTAVVNSGITAANKNAIEATYQALVSGASPTTGILSVVSRYENNAPRATALVRPVVSAVIVDDYPDSQRRRLPGRGT